MSRPLRQLRFEDSPNGIKADKGCLQAVQLTVKVATGTSLVSSNSGMSQNCSYRVRRSDSPMASLNIEMKGFPGNLI